MERLRCPSGDEQDGTARHNGDPQCRNEESNIGSVDGRDGNERGMRREIRSKYRDLIDSVQRNREDLLCPSNNKLTEVLEEADKLFVNVRETSEAVLDSKFVAVATDLNNERASQMRDEDSAFDIIAFAQHLLSFMGLNRLESGGDQQSGDEIDGYLPNDAWQRLARRAEECFRTAPTFHYMLGSFHAEPPPPKQKAERQRRAPSKDAKRIMPTQLKKIEETEQEATEKEVERILACLKDYHQDDPSSAIPYYEFVIDPDSFPRTIENIFHTSFLVRDGLARISLDQDKLPNIAPVEETAMEIDGGGLDNRNAAIVSISPKIWKELIDAFDIRDAMIPPLNNSVME
ncbi:non-structural maintenance of chromosomes element 4 homolog A [Vanacampus margaritifer]